MDASDRLWMREIVSAQDPTLEPCKALYLASFPPDERVPDQTFAKVLEPRALGRETFESQTRLVVALVGEELAGFCSFSCMIDLNAAAPEHYGVIYYMAVVPRLQSTGIGRFMFRAVQSIIATDALCRRAKPMGLMLEVERPDLAADAADRNLRERRIKFYERNECRLLKRIDYLQPSLAAGRNPLRLHLMAAGDLSTRSDRHICKLWYRLVFKLQEDDPVVVAATTA